MATRRYHLFRHARFGRSLLLLVSFVALAMLPLWTLYGRVPPPAPVPPIPPVSTTTTATRAPASDSDEKPFVVERPNPRPGKQPRHPSVEEADRLLQESVARRSELRERRLLAAEDEERHSAPPPPYLLSSDGTIVKEQPNQDEPSWPEEGARCVNDPGVYQPRDSSESFRLHVDDRGYACPSWAVDPDSGCCVTRRRWSCLGCRPEDMCCDRMQFCISCCMGGGPNGTGSNRSFDECRFRCRTSSRTVMQNQDVASLNKKRAESRSIEFPFCYEGKRSARLDTARIVDDSDDRAPPVPEVAKPPAGGSVERKGRTDSVEFLKIY